MTTPVEYEVAYYAALTEQFHRLRGDREPGRFSPDLQAVIIPAVGPTMHRLRVPSACRFV